ncbi:hypothetical protein C5167_004373 [Papaver somniferum]|uniref:Cyclin-like domain-containing protein n=1 Tax=Papaver somniferum TaxID=3469 RepID=A0A4Y7JAH8_PAPSO|nr:hypothetical protein C5167_004373 [Papaver somniferum]
MKKLRSKIPRRKRFQISPILGESSSNSLYRVEKRKPNDEVSSVLIPDEISCTSNLISVGSETLQEFKLSLKQQQQKKKQVVISETENCSDDRRIINRYCYKRKEIEATATEKVSESNSCGVVFSGDEFSGRKWKSRARKVDENDEGDYSYDAEESDYSKTISDLDSEFSDYVGTSLYDSESQTDFSQGSDLNPTAYYSFLTEYSKEFSRLSSVASSDCKISSQIHKDYSEKLTESGLRELNLETVFLCVSLMDRFLSQGFFKTKRKLQLLGIACLTLATRIEENQITRQKTFQIGSDVYSRCEVVAMEWLVQEILNFQCFLPTTYNFLWYCYLPLLSLVYIIRYSSETTAPV